MKKGLILSILGMTCVLSACGQAPVSDIQNASSSQSETSKSDCMAGCQMMRKSNDSNKHRTSADMDADCNSLCDAAQGMENNDVSSCEKSEGILKDTCFTEIAKEKNDIAICKKIVDKTFLYGCYVGIVENTKDSSICKEIDDSMRKSICLEEVKTQ